MTGDMEHRDDELQKVAAMAAAEVVRIIGQVPNAHASTELLAHDVKYIKEGVRKIEEKLEKNYVSVEQFDPVKRIVYFVVSVFGLGVIGAIVALVVKR